MDRRKLFLLFATIGSILVLLPFLWEKLSPDAPVGPSTAEYFPVQDSDTGLWGFIDPQGEMITPMVFEWAGDFRQGRGLAQSQNAMGFISEDFQTTGKWTISPRFELKDDPGDQSAYGFFEGRALARNDAGLWGYIDRDGKWVISPRFPESKDYPGVPAGDFSDGMAWFQSIEMSERNKLDDNDEFIRDEENRILKEEYPRRTVGYIDRSGNVVIEPRYEMAHDFGEGLAAVRIKSQDSWGFIDKRGRQAISPRFEAVSRFSDGLCAVRLHDLWGYIDQDGETVIKHRFQEARMFSEGLAPVREGQKWGYIDPHGQWVIAPIYDDFEDYGHPGDPRPFENGLARVTLNGKRVYINQQGEQVWPRP